MSHVAERRIRMTLISEPTGEGHEVNRGRVTSKGTVWSSLGLNFWPYGNFNKDNKIIKDMGY